MGEAVLYRHEDWQDFRTLETLTRKAGVPRDKLAALVLKELVDNALDAGAECRFGQLDGGGFFVEDNGDGIQGSDAEVAALFSIGRPLTSSKFLRRPTRGALGNGLRVVAGAVLASRGELIVATSGRTLRLVPHDRGDTAVAAVTTCDRKGTRVEVRLGAGLAVGRDVLAWARRAVSLAGRGTVYRGRSSPYWYTDESFWSLLQSAAGSTVRQVIAELDGCGGKKATEIAAAYPNRAANGLGRAEAAALLSTARAACQPVTPGRLGKVGPLPGFPGYNPQHGSYGVDAAGGGCGACIPFVVEAWAARAGTPAIEVCVNRTPVTAEVFVYRSPDAKTDYVIQGCSLVHRFRVGRGKDFRLLLNVQAPYLQHTTDGKEPDLEPVADQALKALRLAAKRAGAGSAAVGTSQKALIRRSLEEAIHRTSGGGKYRYSLRQLFYAMRPTLIESLGREPRYGTFTRIITALEAARGGDLPGMYRDTRGTLYHPHRREWHPVGTLSIEAYRRPAWTFNKILYCEKEGLFPALTDDRWPERHDCALLTSKGYATRAARDTLDLLGQTDEPLTFFCIHDADGPGTLIYQSLVQATDARPGRNVKVVNLGLDVAQARAMGLDVEPVSRKDDRAVPFADYVSAEDGAWLQDHRVELNAMTTPQFLRWLEDGIAAHHMKLVPPEPVLDDRLRTDVRELVRTRITEEVLREAGLDGRVDRAVAGLAGIIEARAANLNGEVVDSLGRLPEQSWRQVVAATAQQVVGADGRVGG